MSIQNRTYAIMERAGQGDRASRAFDLFIVTLIGLNVVMVIVETVDAVAQAFGPVLRAFEAFSVVVFTVEYVLRIWSCTADPDYDGAIVGRLRFAVSGFALIDLLAILPFYLHLFVALDPELVGAVRLLRLFRLFKMGRYIRSIRLLGAVLREKRKEIALVATVLVIVLVLISSLMFYVEHRAQPEAFSSIPAAMWWGMVTLTTIGYGDVFPVTPLGRFFGILIAMLGIGMFALPAGILSSGFVEAIAREGEFSVESSEDVVERFVEAVNGKDLPRILRLTTADHRIVGPDGSVIVGEDRVRAFWESRFREAAYAIVVRETASKDDAVILTGSVAGMSRIPFPAAWEARIADGRIAEWRVYSREPFDYDDME